MPINTFNTLANEDKDSEEGETHDYLVKLVRTEVYDEELGEHTYPYQYTYTHRRFVGKTCRGIILKRNKQPFLK